jgi:hypothetical protein
MGRFSFDGCGVLWRCAFIVQLFFSLEESRVMSTQTFSYPKKAGLQDLPNNTQSKLWTSGRRL